MSRLAVFENIIYGTECRLIDIWYWMKGIFNLNEVDNFRS